VVLGALFVSPAGAQASPSVTLTSQTASVEAALSGQSAFTISLLVAGTSAPVTVATTLYSRLTTRSGLLAALSKVGPSQQIDGTDPVALSCLPASAHGGAALTIDVLTSSATHPTLPGGCTGSAHAPTFDLRCQVGTGSCNGVYPVAITVSSDGHQLARLVTLMTYVERAASVPLRVSTVLRLSAGRLDATTLAATSRVLARNEVVPIDLAVEPGLVQALSGSSAGRQAIAGLAAETAGSRPTREILSAPYVTVDPGVLAATGISGQLSAQLHRGRQILNAAGLSPTDASTWVATSPVTASTTPALASVGLTRLVVPDSSLNPPTASSLSWGQPFTVSPGDPRVDAVAADGVLNSQAQSSTVLGAMQLLGDLSFLHFERPSLADPQGVVITTTESTSSATFLATLLQGLTDNPILEPITLDGLYAEVPAGANGAPSSRHLADSGTSAAWPSSQQAAFAVEQQRQAAFSSAVTAANPVVSNLDDQLLASEDDSLSSAGRSRAIASAAASLDHQLSAVAISGADLTMTALRSSIPITITSQAGYTLTGILNLASTHLRFPNGSSFTEVLDRPTLSLRIEVQAVTTGDLPLFASLRTPEGGLLLARQRILVHATHTSIVAIILTIGSAIVLLVWWLRTWWRKPPRRSRRRAQA
jgi:hypothetical protein